MSTAGGEKQDHFPATNGNQTTIISHSEVNLIDHVVPSDKFLYIGFYVIQIMLEQRSRTHTHTHTKTDAVQ